ncbi:SatD family protein [Gryllotalpicola ginsengisoli]|uniref:SatD family protein n=1 Tax=Gryllotalpicola ginsengisoli TaxID=444608 RepID=UPI0003B6457E|nr:SatD family protein [Gryllotalpicola ginsengisoli]
MYAIIADQINSRSTADRVGAERKRIEAEYGDRLLLPPDRSAGDELQALTDDAATALEIALELTRSQQFHVGLGLGRIRTPLPQSTREATGPAFFAARDAVARAKGTAVRLAVQRQAGADEPSEPARDAEALLTLLLILRDRRSAAGWELYDLLRQGLTQAEAAKRLGITAAAASARARAAQIRAEFAATPALTRLVAQADPETKEP